MASTVTVGLTSFQLEFVASLPQKYFHIGIAAAMSVDIKGMPGGRPIVVELAGEYEAAKHFKLAGSGRADFGPGNNGKSKYRILSQGGNYLCSSYILNY